MKVERFHESMDCGRHEIHEIGKKIRTKSRSYAREMWINFSVGSSVPTCEQEWSVWTAAWSC